MRFFIFVFLCLAQVSFADDVSDMRRILEANFDACNKEDPDALLETCSLDMPRREEFRSESRRLWREKDIYYRLAKFEVLQIEGDYAVARVVQVSHVDDRTSVDEKEAFFRNGTTLLTKSECVEYEVAFKKDGKVWKCYLTLTEPVEYDLDSSE